MGTSTNILYIHGNHAEICRLIGLIIYIEHFQNLQTGTIKNTYWVAGVVIRYTRN